MKCNVLRHSGLILGLRAANERSRYKPRLSPRHFYPPLLCVEFWHVNNCDTIHLLTLRHNLIDCAFAAFQFLSSTDFQYMLGSTIYFTPCVRAVCVVVKVLWSNKPKKLLCIAPVCSVPPYNFAIIHICVNPIDTISARLLHLGSHPTAEGH